MLLPGEIVAQVLPDTAESTQAPISAAARRPTGRPTTPVQPRVSTTPSNHSTDAPARHIAAGQRQIRRGNGTPTQYRGSLSSRSSRGRPRPSLGHLNSPQLFATSYPLSPASSLPLPSPLSPKTSHLRFSGLRHRGAAQSRGRRTGACCLSNWSLPICQRIELCHGGSCPSGAAPRAVRQAPPRRGTAHLFAYSARLRCHGPVSARGHTGHLGLARLTMASRALTMAPRSGRSPSRCPWPSTPAPGEHACDPGRARATAPDRAEIRTLNRPVRPSAGPGDRRWGRAAQRSPSVRTRAPGACPYPPAARRPPRAAVHSGSGHRSPGPLGRCAAVGPGAPGRCSCRLPKLRRSAPSPCAPRSASAPRWER